MNKTQLVDALAARMGDRNTAATAVDGLLETIVDTVGTGESVSITGFGVFESRARAARMARNPRTGEAVDVPATTVPAFRAGAGFRTKVGGGGVPAPRSAPTRRSAAATDTVVEDSSADAPVEPTKGGKGEKAAKKKPAKKTVVDAEADSIKETTSAKDSDGGGKGKKGKKK